jgi:hypothetical protein
MNTITTTLPTINYRTRDGRQHSTDIATCPIKLEGRGIAQFQGSYIFTYAVLKRLSLTCNMVDVSPITHD